MVQSSSTDPWIVELEEACPQASGGFMGYRCPLTACRSSPRGTYRHHPDYCRLQPRACRSNRCPLPRSTTNRNVTHCQLMRGPIIRRRCAFAFSNTRRAFSLAIYSLDTKLRGAGLLFGRRSSPDRHQVSRTPLSCYYTMNPGLRGVGEAGTGGSVGIKRVLRFEHLVPRSPVAFGRT
jgi:hypothetical protein